MKTLILGGVKSGKSRYAEDLAAKYSDQVMVIVTAQALDAAMAARIKRHQANRNPFWQTLEEPLYLQQALQQAAKQPVDAIIIDCLTLWLTNLLLHSDPTVLQRELDAFLTEVQGCAQNLIMVSNETSMGVVPMGELTRRFCDEAGSLHQQLATLCDRAVLMVAGLPQNLK